MTRRKKRKKREKFFDFRSEKDWVSLLAMLFVIGFIAFNYFYNNYVVDPNSPEQIEAFKRARAMQPK